MIASTDVLPPERRAIPKPSAPLHDFPLRDAILAQFSSLPDWLARARAGAEPRLLEIGPGSGYTAHELSRHPVHLTLIEQAGPVAAALEQRFRVTAAGRAGRVRCFQADACEPGLAARMRGAGLMAAYDFVFALDMFEYAQRPEICLANAASLLAPGGEFFLTFPNQPPPRGDGVTHFVSLAAPASLLARAGFRRWQIFRVRLRPWPAAVYKMAHEGPMWVYRRVRTRGPAQRPQTYDGTWAFQQSARWERHAAAVHGVWSLLAAAMRLGGPCFTAQEMQRGTLAGQWVLRAWT